MSEQLVDNESNPVPTGSRDRGDDVVVRNVRTRVLDVEGAECGMRNTRS